MGKIDLLQLYQVLEVPYDAQVKLEELAKSFDITTIKNLFYQDEDAFFDYLENNLSTKYLEKLYIFMHLALDLYVKYIEKGIDIKIYYDTIDDLRIWANNCVKETGVYGLKEVYWLNEHVRMRIFKLGRLQFQKRDASEFMDLIKANNLQQYIKKDYFYFVHIPEGEKLSYDLVLDSYQKALDFFNDEMVFAAESWILSSDLKPVLSENSNLRKFSQDYLVLSERKDENPIKRYLKEGSKLLKAVEDLEKNGIIIGEGFGICLNYIKK